MRVEIRVKKLYALKKLIRLMFYLDICEDLSMEHIPTFKDFVNRHESR